ncbi:MAG: AAA family ATPase [Patescibacteria group bacterium]|nr:AAA family ATPase [Patescibacteria group bacterium]
MYLKRLEIYGFKSFGSKCVLDFSSDGGSTITAIVGPNGSGKSNVADAIRWVLGEQSNSLLRSKKSDDIIFVGSQNKGRSSYAEASLILADDHLIRFEINNKKHELPEIEVTRKLYRSGESEYLLNKKKVRLIDIQQLLASLGFGQSTYSVIGQGMVDRLLFFNASERRVLFDEAAGIKQYKIKREHATKKLLSTEDNLVRLKDILSELEPRVINLRRLVKRAEGRVDIERELSKAGEYYYGSIKTELAKELNGFGQKKKEIESHNLEINQKISLLDKKTHGMQDVADLSDKENRIKQEIDKLLFARDSLIREISYTQGKIEAKKLEADSAMNQNVELKKEEKLLNEKVTFLKEKIEEHQIDINRRTIEKTKIETSLKQLSLKEIENEEKFLKIKSGQKEKELQRIESEIEELSKDKEKLSVEIYSLEQKISQNKTRLEQGNAETMRLTASLTEIKVEIDKQKVEKKGLERLAKTLEERKINLDESVRNLTLKITKIEQEIRTKISIISSDELSKLERSIYELRGDHQKLADALISVKTSNQLVDIKNNFEVFSEKFKEIFKKISLLTEFADPTTREKLENKQLSLREELEKESRNLTETLIALSENKASLGQINGEINKSEQAYRVTERKISEGNSLKGNLNIDDTEIQNLREKAEIINRKILSLEERKKPFSNLESERENAFLMEKDKNNREISSLNHALYEKKLDLAKSINILENQKNEIKLTGERLAKIREMFSTPHADRGLMDEASLNMLSEQKKQLAEIESNVSDLKKEASLLLKDKYLIEEKALDAIRDKHELENQVSTLSHEINQIDLMSARLETKLEDLEEEMKIMGVTLSEKTDYEIFAQEKKDLLRAKIENMKRKKDSIGEVDPETLVEYQELELRVTEMKDQIDDLSKAKEDLEKIIRELDTRIKNQFSKTFTQIAHEFNRYFIMLFNGGKAELKLGEDETGSLGIEITANPPGKKLQSLNVLSGGERTLTSLSLLFAILSINPSPFCVLDEVDAALDESNTLRFSRILKDLAVKTQFVVISHNRETMKSANILYGVTMGENHISKLISVKLGEAQKLAS